MSKYKKYIILGLILSILVLIFGLTACFTFCHGCGRHGLIFMSYACPEKPFMRLSTSIIIITLSGILIAASTILLIFQFIQKNK